VKPTAFVNAGRPRAVLKIP